MQIRVRLVATLASLGLTAAAFGAQTPIAITAASFDANVVVGVGPTGYSQVTYTMDGGNNLSGDTWYQQGQNTSAPTTGLPLGQLITSYGDSTTSYQFQPGGGGNNAIFLNKNGVGPSTGEMTLATPENFSTLSFLTSTSGTNLIDYTLEFSDGATAETGSFTSNDWFGGSSSPVAYYANGRVNLQGGYDHVNQMDPHLFEVNVSLTDTTDKISSILLSLPNDTNSRTAIFAVSGTPVPEPTSLVLIAAGGIALSLRRRSNA